MKMRKVVLDENIIPPITHPWGRVWIQPNPKDIILDDEYAAMKQKDFDLLADYTASEPTGKYNGKMWKGELTLLLEGNGISVCAMMKTPFHKKFTFLIVKF